MRQKRSSPVFARLQFIIPINRSVSNGLTHDQHVNSNYCNGENDWRNGCYATDLDDLHLGQSAATALVTSEFTMRFVL